MDLINYKSRNAHPSYKSLENFVYNRVYDRTYKRGGRLLVCDTPCVPWPTKLPNSSSFIYIGSRFGFAPGGSESNLVRVACAAGSDIVERKMATARVEPLQESEERVKEKRKEIYHTVRRPETTAPDKKKINK